MKWIFLALLAINAVLISMQWLESRNVKLNEYYEDDTKGGGLKLLSELEGGQLSVAQSGGMCLLVGPLESKKLADEILNSLGGEDKAARLVEQNINKAPADWV